MSNIRWQGLIEVIYTEYKIEDIPDSIKVLKKRLDSLEAAKTLQEIRDRLVFTLDERNYLNSPPLDELYKTIFSDIPIKKALSIASFFAYNFYLERGVALKLSKKFIDAHIKKDNIACIKFIDEKGLVQFTSNDAIYAVKNNAENVFKYFVEKKYMNQDTSGPSILYTSNAEIVKLSLRSFNFNMHDKNIALSFLSNHRYPFEVLKILLNHGADINAFAGDILFYAIRERHTSYVKFLLENGASLMGIHTHICCRYGTAEIMKLLIEKYIIYDKDCVLRLTQLRNAAFCGNLEIVKYIVESGADPKDQAALTNSRENNHEEIIEYLLSFSTTQ